MYVCFDLGALLSSVQRQRLSWSIKAAPQRLPTAQHLRRYIAEWC
jgi:hypothetical protein